MISFAILSSAFVFCYAILSMLIVLAPRIGLVDHPGGRKPHRKQTPLVGGLAIAITLLFALVILRPAVALHMIIAVSILLVVGVADDLVEALTRDRKGQHNIRIKDQWRICFVWRGDSAYKVEIVDYH